MPHPLATARPATENHPVIPTQARMLASLEAALDSIADQLLPVFEAQNSSSAFVEAIPAFVGDMFSRFHISQTNSLSPGYPRSGCQV